MRSLAALFVVVAGGCTQPAGEPKLVIDPGPWFVGETTTAHVEWNPITTCSQSVPFDCTSTDAPSFELAAVTCHGCMTSGVTLHQTVSNAAAFSFEATSTDAIEIDVTVESGGSSYDLSLTGTGDRETGIALDCSTVPTDLLVNHSSYTPHPCGATRRADDTALFDVSITTLHGVRTQFPFCTDGGSCTPMFERKTSQIDVSPAPDYTGAFGRYGFWRDTRASEVTITLPLATGELATATVAMPSEAR